MRGCDTWQRRAFFLLPSPARKSIHCLANPSPLQCDFDYVRFEETDNSFGLVGVTMTEERISSVGGDEPEKKGEPVAKDRKSLTGMSEKVKATLAPLLGGIKHHPEVEVDLGRESGAATYETVPMGSTPMTRYSTNAGDPSLLDKVKHTVHGIYSGKGTNLDPDHLPVQDVGLGHSGSEDKYVLDGSVDPVHRFRSTTPTSEGENPFNG